MFPISYPCCTQVKAHFTPPRDPSIRSHPIPVHFSHHGATSVFGVFLLYIELQACVLSLIGFDLCAHFFSSNISLHLYLRENTCDMWKCYVQSSTNIFRCLLIVKPSSLKMLLKSRHWHTVYIIHFAIRLGDVYIIWMFLVTTHQVAWLRGENFLWISDRLDVKHGFLFFQDFSLSKVQGGKISHIFNMCEIVAYEGKFCSKNYSGKIRRGRKKR